MASSEDIDAMSEILNDRAGIDLTNNQLSLIVDDYNGHKEICLEMESYAHIPSKVVKQDPKIKELESEIEAYRNFIRSKYGDVYIDVRDNEVVLTSALR